MTTDHIRMFLRCARLAESALMILPFAALTLLAQQTLPLTPHALERALHPLELYRDAQLAFPELMPMSDVPRTAGAPFNVVYGWYPYWISTSAASRLRPDLLTHIAWFSVGVDTSTGGLESLDSWKSTQVVTWAKSKGLKVHLTITCFGSRELAALLSSPTKRARCIAEIAQAVALRSADGVNIDFELLPLSERATMVAFMQGLRAAMPSKELTIATPSVDWSKSWDLKALSEISDFLVMMGYDYYYSGSTTAGPVAPLRSETYNVSKSIDAHLSVGVDPSRLAVAVPLYGRTWWVTSTARKATVVSSSSGSKSTTPTYSSVQTQSGFPTRTFDAATSTSWFNYDSGGTVRQTWIDDSASLAAKYLHVKSKGLRGIGYWALGYDGGQRSMWDGLQAMSTSTDLAEENTLAEPTADPDRTVLVFTLLGQCVYSGRAGDRFTSAIVPGCYIVVDGTARTVMIR